jgi:hypothetical protein
MTNYTCVQIFKRREIPEPKTSPLWIRKNTSKLLSEQLIFLIGEHPTKQNGALYLENSVADPYSLNRDPDPGFLANSDPDLPDAHIYLGELDDQKLKS